MKKIKTIHVQIILLLLFAIVAWAFWAFAYPAHLHFMEQLQIFEFTSGYFCDVIVKPAGLAEYISRFLVQFFYVGAFGPVIMALLLTAIYHAATLLYHPTSNTQHPSPITKTWAGFVLKNSLALVPALLCWAFVISMDAKPTMLISMVVALYSVWATEKANGKARAIIAVIASVILAFTIGSVFMVYVFLVFGRMAVEAACQKEWKKVAFNVVGALVLWGLVILALSRLYPYPTDVLTWGRYYNRFVFIVADYNTTTWWITILVGLLMTRVRPMLWQYAAPVVTIICSCFIFSATSADEEAMLDNIYLMHNEDWDAIMANAEKRTPATSYEQTPLNLALAMKRQLADKYFTMRQFGTDGLLPVYQMDYMTPLLSADAYYQMGMVNTAQRYYYESMESIGDHQKSAFMIKRLAMTALANGRLNLARGYIHKLKNTLYYSDWAREMQQYADYPSTMYKNKELRRLCLERTKQESFFNDFDQPPYIAEMLNCNPNNEVAWQYLFTMLMVEGRGDELMRTAVFFQHHFQGKMLPTHVQEALLYLWVSKTGSLAKFPFQVTVSIGNRFMAFAKAAHQPRSKAEPVVRDVYGDTYWCYAIFQQQEAQQRQQQAVDGHTNASAQQSSRE